MTTTGDTPATGAPDPDNDTTDSNDHGDEFVSRAEFEELRKQARKWEARAKSNAQAAKELDDLRKQSMDETQRAIAEAVEKTRTEVLGQVGSKLVAAEIRAAATGRKTDVDALIDGVNLSRFLNEDGDPDRESINEWLDKVAPAGTADDDSKPSAPDLGQGKRGQPPALNSTQLERDIKAALGIA